MREKSEELRAAVEEWQLRNGTAGPQTLNPAAGQAPRPLLTTGFLDGAVPIVDVYELKVPPPAV